MVHPHQESFHGGGGSFSSRLFHKKRGKTLAITTITLTLLFALTAVIFWTGAGSAVTEEDYICEGNEKRATHENDCCPSSKNYVCEDYGDCENVDPDCITLGTCSGTNNEYNASTIFGYTNSINFCYPGRCVGGACDSDCSDLGDAECTSGFCTTNICNETTTDDGTTSPCFSLQSPGVAVFEGEDLSIAYTVINTCGSTVIITGLEFDGVLGRFFEPDVTTLEVTSGTRETFSVDIDAFALSKMFISYLEPGRYNVRANITNGTATAGNILEFIVLPTQLLQNTKEMPPHRTIGHMIREVMVNDTYAERTFPAEVEVWVW